jgi:AcrR family transcriptional regulator
MEKPNNQTHQRILDVAEALFSERGYTSVRLRDIASEIGIKHAALYYYAPGGKEQLFVDVMTRNLQRHRLGMEAAIATAGLNLRDQMRAVAQWLLAQPPLNLARMEASDFPAISSDNAQKLSLLIFDSLRLPLQDALERAHAEGTVAVQNAGLAAITFTSLVQTVRKQAESERVGSSETAVIVDELIDMLLYGWLKR